ncbi:cation-transporting ATPase I [Actinopolymorpha cephalotaxi]|uniref:Cation-transporting ATPase I n=1 Tax=Actinopolymorpha cephalotaxi TaxID=504797 RepID=A0A1I3BM94_9ACTN|nr:cation-transporting P-type ATPase [Actinopolymorpha cephalotaxi]NYH82861.1 cation-transporting ATPase I [Actinopolymorpha cephalotaxi]SFH63290.1 cation-transporting ATPase I [Actinopolymorpha cephalotaxi]
MFLPVVGRLVPGALSPGSWPRRGRTTRRSWVGNGRAHVEVRGVDRPGSGHLAEEFEDAVLALPGVRRAWVNAVLGRVVVEYDGGAGEGAADVLGDVSEVPEEEAPGVPVEVLTAVAAVERRHGLAGEPFPPRPDHPGDVEPRQWQLVAFGADVAALGFSVAGRALRIARLPAEVPTLVGLIDSTPRLRREWERLLGRSAADLTLAAGNALAQGLAQGPLGLLVDAAQRLALADEAGRRGRVWAGREGELSAADDGQRTPALSLPPRPAPLPPGPVERLADVAGLASMVGAGATMLATRDPRRTIALVGAGIPKAGHVAREAFATGVNRALAARGTLCLDPEALRRLDRVDTVVLDAAILRTDGFVLGPLTVCTPEAAEFVRTNGRKANARKANAHGGNGHHPDGAGPAVEARLRLRAESLFDPALPKTVHRQGGWTLGPLTELTHRLGSVPAAVRATAHRLAGQGAVALGLARGGELVAVLAAEPEFAPLADALVAAAGGAGEVMVAGRGSGVAGRLGVERDLPAGNRLPGAIRALQAEGRVVVLVGVGPGAALATADCGIGVPQRGHRPPWGAHLLSGPGLSDACLLLDAAAAAKAVSRRGAALAGYGSVTGALLAALGPARGATERALIGVNVAAAAGFVSGTWSAAALAHRPEPVRTDRNHWHSLDASAALRRLRSTPRGLTEHEAAARLPAVSPDGDDHHANVLSASLEELANPLTPTLAAGAGVAAASGSVSDAALIGAVMGVNAVIGGMQRVGTDRAVRRLADTSAARVRVRRDGHEVEVLADQLVPGDVVVLRAGDAVPADARILTERALETDESSLTGESQLVAKTAEPCTAADVADRSSMVYDGTVVAAGRTSALVVATGAETEAGRGTRAMAAHRPPGGGVQERLNRLVRLTVPVSLSSGAALVGVGLLRGRRLRDTLGTAVSLAVASVPEGLPVVATVAQLASARRLSARNALVRNPPTVETLGRVTTLLLDKTGTLTEGRIRLRRVSDGIDEESLDQLGEQGALVLAAGLRASPEHVAGEVPAHPTDRAVVDAALEVGVRADTGAPGWTLVDDVPFESGRGYHAALGATDDGQRLVVKGAPEIVMPKCRRWRRGAGVRPLDDADREKVEAEVHRLAGQGFRVLAVAERAASGRRDLTEDRVERLELLGFLAFADQVRPTSAQAVALLRRAGVGVVMLTGDHPTTAASIAAELGILDSGRVLTGTDLDAHDDASLAAVLPEVSVVARVTPAQKVRVVRTLQSIGRTVAMAGDGSNDAPAIRLADVGIALGRHGTTAAREAADLVVTDDRLETITDAIVEGRAMWASVRDAIAVLVGGNLGETAFTLGAGLLSPSGSPLNARQLLLVNLFTDVLPAMALAIRPPAHLTPEALLHEGPDASLGSRLARDVAIRAGATAAAASAGWAVGRATGTPGRAGTIALVAMVGAQLGQSVVTGWRSPLVVGAGAVSWAGLATVVQAPGLSHFFGCRPLGPLGWATALGAAGAGTALGSGLEGLTELAVRRFSDGFAGPLTQPG